MKEKVNKNVFIDLFDIRLVLVCLLSLLFFTKYTLSSPYHYDTVAYIKGIKDFIEKGTFGYYFSSRFLNTYFYAVPTILFGEVGFKILNVIVITLFLFLYYFLLKRDYSKNNAFLSALLIFSIPATVITTTHLKEDYNSLLFFAISLLVIGKGPNLTKSFIAGVFYGISFLFKEFPLVLFPFLTGYLYLKVNEVKKWKDFFSYKQFLRFLPPFISLIFGFLVIVFLINPNHFSHVFSRTKIPHMAHFLGPFSKMQNIGIEMWKEGILYAYPLHFILLISLPLFIKQKNFFALLWLSAFLVLFIFTSNITTVRAYHFVWASFFIIPVIIGTFFTVLKIFSSYVSYEKRERG